MLERYDTSGCPRVRPDKSAETEPANHFGNCHRVDCGGLRLVEPLLAGRARYQALLYCSARAGLQDRLRHLDARSAVGAASRPASEISVQRFLSRLGTGWGVGPHQDAESLWCE